MTDLEVNAPGAASDQNQSIPTAPTAPAVVPAPAVASSPVPVALADIHDVQTPENTPMAVFVPPVSEVIRELTEEEREAGFMTVFLGNSKQSQTTIREIVSKWLTVQGVRELFKEGRAPVTALNKAEEDWKSYVEASHPGKSPAEMEKQAGELYRFVDEIQDEIAVRSKVMNEEGVTNMNNRGSGVTSPDIIGKKPSRSVKGFKLSDIMRRATLRSENTSLNFDVLLRDSFTLLTFERPSRVDMGNLINDIRREVRGYVRQVNNNSAVIANVAAGRVIWKFIADRIVSCSVSDITDFKDLGNLITISDMGRLVMALLESFSSKGVNMNLRCLGEKCDWSMFALVDPALAVKHRHWVETPEEQAIYGNLLNGTKKYTMEEVKARIKASTYGLDTNRVYNENKSIYLEIAPPTLNQAFETFDFFIGQVNPRLAEIRSKVQDPNEYETQVGMVFNDLGATEFIHWVSAFVSKAPVDSDEADIVIRREDSDPNEFNQGIWSNILDSEYTNRALTKFILNKVPYMTRNVIGVRNYVCPKCSQNSGDLQDPAELLERKLGYTPIDPVMSFFTHTHLMMLSQAVESSRARSEALSE